MARRRSARKAGFVVGSSERDKSSTGIDAKDIFFLMVSPEVRVSAKGRNT